MSLAHAQECHFTYALPNSFVKYLLVTIGKLYVIVNLCSLICVDCKTVGRDRRREARASHARRACEARKTDCRLSIQRIRSVQGSGDGLDNAANAEFTADLPGPRTSLN